ncbi:S41 family peptidase [Erythrobacter sp.]|uniref:S41 family peptidase n=1 Tax=Erythrobacter sp. TaxID=1042 RepID=UPI00311F6D18
MRKKAAYRRLRITVLVATCCVTAPLSANPEPEPDVPTSWGFEEPEMIKRGGGFSASDPSKVTFDTEIKRNGNQSLRIDSTANEDRRIWIDFSFPHDRRKGEVEFAFYLRADTAAMPVNLVSMTRGRSGEQDIRRFPIDLKSSGSWVRAQAKVPVDVMDMQVVVGIEASGEGRLWVDDFSITLGGEPFGLDPRRNWGTSRFAAGSGIALDSLTPRQSADVAVLAKVWGFLKYHHPAGQSGTRNWDDEFLALLGPVLVSGSEHERDQLILEWLRSLGEVPECTDCATPSVDPMLKAPDPQSLWHDVASPELRQALAWVYDNRARLPHQVFAYRYSVGQAHFSNELAYRDMDPDDDGFRLLAVARYWNMVRYWFPYRDLIDEPWEPVLEDALRDVVRGEGREAYIGAIRRLIARVDDTHALMYTDYAMVPPAGACFPQPHIRYVEGVPLIVETGGAEQVMVGDRLAIVDGTPVTQIETEARPYYASSNSASFYRDLGRNLLRGECGSIAMEIERGGQKIAVELPREDQGWRPDGGRRDTPSRGRPGPALQWLDDNVLYVSLEALEMADLEKMKERLGTARAAIFDLRGYSGRVSVHSLLAKLSPEPVSFAGFTVPNMETPGEFVWEPLRPLDLEHDPALFAGPIAILADETVQSASEYATMGLQSIPGSFVVGSTTAGADGNVAQFSLPGGLFTAFSGIGVFYPDKTPTQQVGIRIDYPVHPTIEGVRTGGDEQLDVAIEQVRSRLLTITSGVDEDTTSAAVPSLVVR